MRGSWKGLAIAGVIVAAWTMMTAPASAKDACAPKGRVHYLCGLANVEDLVQVPGTSWIVASGMSGPNDPAGHLYFIDAAHRTSKLIAPDLSGPATAPFAGCPGPIDMTKIAPHGVGVRPGPNGRHTLYVVNHGSRESVEVFALNAGRGEPSLKWIGCLVMPDGLSGNAVAPLPRGGLVLTKFQQAGDPKSFEKMANGELVGALYVWTPASGFSQIPYSAMIAANGVEVSRDGRWIVANDWPGRRVYRFRRGSSARPASVPMPGFLPDNVRMGSDGRLLVAGQDGDIKHLLNCAKAPCPHGWTVVSLDPATMKVSPVAHVKGELDFSDATAALKVGRELWVGTYRGDRVAVLPAR